LTGEQQDKSTKKNPGIRGWEKSRGKGRGEKGGNVLKQYKRIVVHRSLRGGGGGRRGLRTLILRN